MLKKLRILASDPIHNPSEFENVSPVVLALIQNFGSEVVGLKRGLPSSTILIWRDQMLRDLRGLIERITSSFVKKHVDDFEKARSLERRYEALNDLMDAINTFVTELPDSWRSLNKPWMNIKLKNYFDLLDEFVLTAMERVNKAFLTDLSVIKSLEEGYRPAIVPFATTLGVIKEIKGKLEMLKVELPSKNEIIQDVIDYLTEAQNIFVSVDEKTAVEVRNAYRDKVLIKILYDVGLSKEYGRNRRLIIIDALAA